MSTSLKILQLDTQSQIFALDGEIDQYFQQQQQVQHNGPVSAFFLPPDSVSTPRTNTTNTADNSPRYSEALETVSSVDENAALLREVDVEFQTLLQNVAENVAEMALGAEEQNQLRQQQQQQQKRSFHDSFLSSAGLSGMNLGAPVTTYNNHSIPSSLMSLGNGVDMDSFQLSVSQDLLSDRRLFQPSPRNRLHTQSPPYEAHSSPASPVSQPIQARPEWQKLCIQHSVCIHNIYGNCAYGSNCYYFHLDSFQKPDLLFKTELCRYGVECANRPRCCFAHTKKERRTPEQNVRDALSKIRLPPQPQAQQQVPLVNGVGLHVPGAPGPMQGFGLPLTGLQGYTQAAVRHPIALRSHHHHQQQQQQQQHMHQMQSHVHGNMLSELSLSHLIPPFQYPFQ